MAISNNLSNKLLLFNCKRRNDGKPVDFLVIKHVFCDKDYESKEIEGIKSRIKDDYEDTYSIKVVDISGDREMGKFFESKKVRRHGSFI